MVDAGFVDAGGRRPRGAGAADGRAARARGRGAVLRRLRRRRRSTDDYPGLTTTTDKPVDVYTTLDLHLQRLAQDAVRDGLTKVDETAVAPQAQGRGRGRARSRSIRGPARSSRWSADARTTSRSTTARSSSRRQPGSVFKPFVYLAAFEQAAAGRRRDRHHAGVDRRRLADDVGVRRSGVDAGELRERVRRRRSRSAARSPTRATSRRSRSPSRPATTASPRSGSKLRRRHAAQGLSVDRARRVRSDAVRDRHGVHALPEHGRRCGRSGTSLRIDERRQGRDARSRRRRRGRSRGRTRRSSSPT